MALHPSRFHMPTTTSNPAGDCRSCAIRQGCLIAQLGDAECALLVPQIRRRVFHRSDSLVEEGKIANSVSILKLGTAFAYRRGLDGCSRPIGILGRGNAFGLFGMFESPSQSTVVAHTTVRVCEIPVDTLRDMNICGSKLQIKLIQALVESYAAMAAWSAAMRVSGVVNQLACAVALLADASKSTVVELPSQSALAELLGTRRESIARALRTLASEGGIHRLERKRCEVFRSQLLARLSQGAR